MASRIDIGMMRTKVHFYEPRPSRSSTGQPIENPVDVFGGAVWCKWVTQHGSEVFEDMRTEAVDQATITMHYSPKVNVKQFVTRKNKITGEDERYEIVSINDVEDKNQFLEVYVRRNIKG